MNRHKKIMASLFGRALNAATTLGRGAVDLGGVIAGSNAAQAALTGAKVLGKGAALAHDYSIPSRLLGGYTFIQATRGKNDKLTRKAMRRRIQLQRLNEAIGTQFAMQKYKGMGKKKKHKSMRRK